MKDCVHYERKELRGNEILKKFGIPELEDEYTTTYEVIEHISEDEDRIARFLIPLERNEAIYWSNIIAAFNPSVIFAILNITRDITEGIVKVYRRQHPSEEDLIKLCDNSYFKCYYLFKIAIVLNYLEFYKLHPWNRLEFIELMVKLKRYRMLAYTLREGIEDIQVIFNYISRMKTRNQKFLGLIFLNSYVGGTRSNAKRLKVDTIAFYGMDKLNKIYKMETIAAKVIQRRWRDILCNPHHPAGKRYLLKQMTDLCESLNL